MLGNGIEAKDEAYLKIGGGSNGHERSHSLGKCGLAGVFFQDFILSSLWQVFFEDVGIFDAVLMNESPSQSTCCSNAPSLTSDKPPPLLQPHPSLSIKPIDDPAPSKANPHRLPSRSKLSKPYPKKNIHQQYPFDLPVRNSLIAIIDPTSTSPASKSTKHPAQIPYSASLPPQTKFASSANQRP